MIESVGENLTRITAIYEFPSTAYKPTLKDVKIRNNTAILFVDINRSDIGLGVMTLRNVTVVVNGSIDTAIVITAVPN